MEILERTESDHLPIEININFNNKGKEEMKTGKMDMKLKWIKRKIESYKDKLNEKFMKTEWNKM